MIQHILAGLAVFAFILLLLRIMDRKGRRWPSYGGHTHASFWSSAKRIGSE